MITFVEELTEEEVQKCGFGCIKCEVPVAPYPSWNVKYTAESRIKKGSHTENIHLGIISDR